MREFEPMFRASASETTQTTRYAKLDHRGACLTPQAAQRLDQRHDRGTDQALCLCGECPNGPLLPELPVDIRVNARQVLVGRDHADPQREHLGGPLGDCECVRPERERAAQVGSARAAVGAEDDRGPRPEVDAWEVVVDAHRHDRPANFPGKNGAGWAARGPHTPCARAARPSRTCRIEGHACGLPVRDDPGLAFAARAGCPSGDRPSRQAGARRRVRHAVIGAGAEDAPVRAESRRGTAVRVGDRRWDASPDDDNLSGHARTSSRSASRRVARASRCARHPVARRAHSAGAEQGGDHKGEPRSGHPARRYAC
jgi:hypothetical protein